MFNNLYDAYSFLKEHTYFTKPYYNENGKIFSFGNEFTTDCINPLENGQLLVEYGSYSLDGKGFYHNYKNDFTANTYEEAIIELANRIYNRYGNDFVMDYYIVVGDIEFKEIPNSEYGEVILPDNY